MMIIKMIKIIIIYPPANPSAVSRIYDATGILFDVYIIYLKKCIIYNIHTYILDLMFSTYTLFKIMYILYIIAL